MYQVMYAVTVENKHPEVPECVPEPLASAMRRAFSRDQAQRPTAQEMLDAARASLESAQESPSALCVMHRGKVDAANAVACTGGQEHHACRDCLSKYVRSQENLAGALRERRGSVQCSAPGCDGVLPREEVVRVLAADATALFLRGIEEAAREEVREGAERKLEDARREIEALTAQLHRLGGAGACHAPHAHESESCSDSEDEAPERGHGSPGGAGWRVTASTYAQLREAVRRGGESLVDLKGFEIPLEEPLVVKAGSRLRIRDGTLSAGGMGRRAFMVVAEGTGASLDMEGVTVERTGVKVGGGAAARMTDCAIQWGDGGLWVAGDQSRVEMRRGRVEGIRGENGVLIEGGGMAELRGVVIEDCQGSGVCVRNDGSAVEMEECGVHGSRGSHGVTVEDGGFGTICDSMMCKSRLSGIRIAGSGSRVQAMRSGVKGSRELHGVLVRDGAAAELKGVQVEDSRQCGVRVRGAGSVLDMEGGGIYRSATSYGLSVADGGGAVVRGVSVVGNSKGGVHVKGMESRAEVHGSRVEGGTDVGEGGTLTLTDALLDGVPMSCVQTWERN